MALKGTSIECAHCGRQRPYFAKGLCASCYTLARRQSATEQLPADQRIRLPVGEQLPFSPELADCAGDNPDNWTAEGASADMKAYAKRVCADCPMQRACFTFGYTHQVWGIWGGEEFGD